MSGCETMAVTAVACMPRPLTRDFGPYPCDKERSLVSFDVMIVKLNVGLCDGKWEMAG